MSQHIELFTHSTITPISGVQSEGYFTIDRSNEVITEEEPPKAKTKTDNNHEFTTTHHEVIPVYSNGLIQGVPRGGPSDEEKELMFAQDDLEYPEGGLKANMVVFGSFMGLIPCFGLLNSIGAIETYISENQLANVPSSTTAWIFSIFLFVNYASCVFSGTFFDRNGARAPLIAGSLISSGGLLATANCNTTYQFILAFGIVTGFGNGTTLSPLVSVISHYFSKKRGLYSSIATTGGSIGGIGFPLMLRKLFEEVGYAWTMRVLSFTIFGCYLVAIVLARERLPHVHTNNSTSVKVMGYLKAFDLHSFKQWRYVFLVLGCAFGEVSVLTTSTFYTSYTRAHGASLSTAYLLTTLVNAAGIPGRWFTGYLSDYYGRFNMIILTLFTTGVITLVILLPFGDRQSALYAFSIIYGFATGSFFSLIGVCCGQISKTEDFGKRYSTMYFIVAFGTLASVPIAGAIVGDRDVQHFNNFMIFSAVTSICASLFYAGSRAICVGPGLTKKF